MGVYEPTDFDIDIGNDNEIFSSQLRKLPLVQINERWRKHCMNMINGRWNLHLCRFPLLEKQSRELSYPFRSVFSVPWLLVQNHFLSLTWGLFCRWSENCFCRWSLLSCSVSLWIQNYFSSAFFCRWSHRSKLQELFCRRTSIPAQLVLFLHSHDRHTSCLVALPAFKIISLAERYSPSYLLLY